MKLINDVITHLLDPSIYFSRFSFLESGKEAINIKYEVRNSSIVLNFKNRNQKLQLFLKSETNSIQEVH